VFNTTAGRVSYNMKEWNGHFSKTYIISGRLVKDDASFGD